MEQSNSSESGAGAATDAISVRERWGAIVVEHRASGVSVSAFCRSKSIPTSSFYGWRQKLEGRPRQPRLAVQGSGPAFVAVKMKAGPAGRRPIELRLRGGRRDGRLRLGVVLRRGFDRQVLIEAVRVLEELA